MSFIALQGFFIRLKKTLII